MPLCCDSWDQAPKVFQVLLPPQDRRRHLPSVQLSPSRLCCSLSTSVLLQERLHTHNSFCRDCSKLRRSVYALCYCMKPVLREASQFLTSYLRVAPVLFLQTSSHRSLSILKTALLVTKATCDF